MFYKILFKIHIIHKNKIISFDSDCHLYLKIFSYTQYVRKCNNFPSGKSLTYRNKAVQEL